MEYLDFDLEVTAADGGAFTVRVLRSPAGSSHVLVDSGSGSLDVTSDLGGNSVEPTWR